MNLISPHFYATVSKEDLTRILCSDSGKVIPLLDERHQVLQETGGILLQVDDR